MASRILHTHGRRRLAQHLFQQESGGWHPGGSTDALKGLGRGRCLATDAPGAPGAPTDDRPAEHSAPPGASRGRGRGQRIAAQLQDLRRGTPAREGAGRGRPPNNEGQAGPKQRMRPPGARQSPFEQQQQQRMGQPRPRQGLPRRDGPLERGRYGTPGAQQPGGWQGPPQFRRGPPGQREAFPGPELPVVDPEDDLMGTARQRFERGRRSMLGARRGPGPGAEDEEGQQWGPPGRPSGPMTRRPGPPRRGGAAANDGPRGARRSEADWDVSGDGVEQFKADESQGPGRWETKFDSRADLARREQLHRLVAELVNGEAAEQLRAGPWMLDAADNPVALPSELEIEQDRRHLLRMELDPEFDMALGGPPPPRQPAPDQALGDALEDMRPELCATLGIDAADDAAWAALTDGAVEAAQQQLKELNIRPARDSWGEIAELEALLDELLPADHTMRPHCRRTVDALAANSSYSSAQRCALLRRKVLDLTSPLPPRLAARDMFATQPCS